MHVIKNLGVLFFGAFLILLSACSKNNGDGMPPAMVTLAPIKTQLWQPSFEAIGTVNAILGAQLKSEVAGRITQIYFQPGQQVHRGDSLLDINPAQLLASYHSAQADAALAQANLDRAVVLYHKKFIAKQDYETTLDKQKTALAALNLAAANLAQARITAPFDGTVGINKVNVGDYITVGTALLNLEELNQLRVDFTVPENLVGKVQIGDRVTLNTKDHASKALEGKVVGVDTAVDADTRMFSVRAIFDNTPDNKSILPGSFAEVTLFYGPGLPVMVVPQEAVVSDGDADSLFVAINGHAKLMPVKLGERFTDQVVVKSGVKPGDIIVTAGIVKVHEGMPVVDPVMMAAMAAKKSSNNSSAAKDTHG